jgi:hypothetical protein
MATGMNEHRHLDERVFNEPVLMLPAAVSTACLVAA